MFCIIRGCKVKFNSDISASAKHNLRIGQVHDMIDNTLSGRNVTLVNRFNIGSSGSSDLRVAVNKYYDALPVIKRKDSVLMYEWILGASPEYFIGLGESKLNQWINHQLDFLNNEFGSSVTLVNAHFDEKSPHLHCLITVDELKTRNYANRFGKCSKKCYALNANRFNKVYLLGLQDRYADWNSKLGLKRGKNCSNTVHINRNEYISGLSVMKDKWVNSKKIVEHYKSISGSIQGCIIKNDSLLRICLDELIKCDADPAIISLIESHVLQGKTINPKV